MGTFGRKIRQKYKDLLKWSQKDRRKKVAKQATMIKHLVAFKLK